MIGDSMSEEYDDAITEDPDSQVDDDEMSPAEAAFTKGAEEASQGKKKSEDDDEVK
jgi:hypothetical protein